jgi:drug/metabolite transporter (DMT)-like permease
MNIHPSAWTRYGSTALFVLLWSAGAIFTKWGLAHGTIFAFLILRFALAFSVLFALGLHRKRLMPAPGTRLQVAGAGAIMIGCYTINFFLALAHGVNPGVLATVLGVQPILTLVWQERRLSSRRALGLGVALAGLMLIVYQSLVHARFQGLGTVYALGALISVTTGAILQKRVQQPPAEVLPLQYGVSLLMCCAFLPFQPFSFELTAGFLLPLLWMGLLISVVAQLLLYRLIRGGNLVNVTSLFYLVPIATALMDYVFFGNALQPLGMLGMLAILAGLGLVFARGSARGEG